MVGCELRINFDMLGEDTKQDIKYLCKKYNIKPECRTTGGLDNIAFDFRDDIESRDAFSHEMSILLDIPSAGVRRRVFGYRVQCPL